MANTPDMIGPVPNPLIAMPTIIIGTLVPASPITQLPTIISTLPIIITLRFPNFFTRDGFTRLAITAGIVCAMDMKVETAMLPKTLIQKYTPIAPMQTVLIYKNRNSSACRKKYWFFISAGRAVFSGTFSTLILPLPESSPTCSLHPTKQANNIIISMMP